METYFLENKDLLHFYDRIARDYDLYVPVNANSSLKVKCEYAFDLPDEDYLLKRYSEVNKEEIVFNRYRSIEPARAFFTYVKEAICDYFNGGDGAATGTDKEAKKPVAICGLKNCDLFSLKIQDFVFLGGTEADPSYKIRRESTLIISGDCPAFKEACFCRAFDINPHVTEGFDFNLSPIGEGYLLDVASEKAKKIIFNLKDIISRAGSKQLSEREGERAAVIKRLEEHLSLHKIPKKELLKEIVLAGYNSKLWDEQMRTCVECGGCMFMCDTCHCFLLFDEESQANARRLRIWDGCMYKNFTRVAGGANPLKMRYMRLRNRYLKKFDFFIETIGFQACCGCGRCIDVCPGRIDIRYILRRLYEEKYIPAH